MQKYQPIDLLGGFYTDDALSWSCQDTVNWLPVVAEVSGTRTLKKLRTPPGLALFGTAGSQPVRGARNVEGRLFVVAGTTLYEVSAGGIATSRGTIPGVGRVAMSHNQVTFGNELLIANGDAGYVWNTVTSTLTKISDEGYPGAVSVDYIDQYLVQVEPFGRFWFHSELADALSYNTLDRYESEVTPDKLVGIATYQLEVVAFSERSIEFFANTGAATGTFASKRIAIQRGCASRDTITKLADTLFWLGDDGAVYMLQGYQAVPISTRAIEIAIQGLNWSQAFGFAWDDSGHKVYYLTFPDGQTWGYDLANQVWSRRASYEMDRWRLNTLTEFGGGWIGGDFQNGNLYRLDWNTYHENGAPMVSERTTGVSHAEQNRVLAPYIELIFDTGSDGPSLPVISGDVPDGIVGEGVTGAYTVSGGIPAYSAITVLSGTFPPGLTLNPDGTYSGMFTAPGSYAWTVGGVDAVGQPFSTADAAEVVANVDALWDDVVSLWRPVGELGSTLVDDEKPPFWGSPDASQKPVIVEESDSFSLTALQFSAADIGDILYTVQSEGSIVQAEPFGMGTGDFTYEGFVEFDSIAGTQTIVQTMQSAPAPAVQLHSGQWRVWNVSGGTDIIAPVGSAPVAGEPVFVQLIRNTGVLQLWVDGVMLGSVAHTFDYSTSQPTYYGRQQNTANELDGRLWMWRITKGHARPTTIPTLPFPNVGP